MRHDEVLGRGAVAGGGRVSEAREERAMLRRAFALSHPAFLNFNMRTMEANCLTMAMSPAIERFCADDAARRDAYLGYQESFNTNAVGLVLVVGVCSALERDEELGAAPRGSARMARASLMGPLARRDRAVRPSRRPRHRLGAAWPRKGRDRHEAVLEARPHLRRVPKRRDRG